MQVTYFCHLPHLRYRTERSYFDTKFVLFLNLTKLFGVFGCCIWRICNENVLIHSVFLFLVAWHHFYKPVLLSPKPTEFKRRDSTNAADSSLNREAATSVDVTGKNVFRGVSVNIDVYETNDVSAHTGNTFIIV